MVLAGVAGWHRRHGVGRGDGKPDVVTVPSLGRRDGSGGRG